MSDGEKERDSGFKVTDRRLFTPDGEPRTDVEPTPPAEEPSAPPPEPEKKAAPPPPPREQPGRSAPPADPHPFTAAPGEPPPPGQAAQPPLEDAELAEVGFSNFLLSLATTAMVGLGEMPDPATGLVAQNVESARQMIDILGMLKEKTQGNLNPEETRLLEGLLYELRMKYVAVQGGGPAPGPPPTGATP